MIEGGWKGLTGPMPQSYRVNVELVQVADFSVDIASRFADKSDRRKISSFLKKIAHYS